MVVAFLFIPFKVMQFIKAMAEAFLFTLFKEMPFTKVMVEESPFLQ